VIRTTDCFVVFFLLLGVVTSIDLSERSLQLMDASNYESYKGALIADRVGSGSATNDYEHP